MRRPFDVVLLLALPASGRAEIRRYLDSLPTQTRLEEFGLGPVIRLGDVAYLRLLRRIDRALEEAGRPPLYFASAQRSFRDPRDWGTLIELVNEDFAALGKKDVPKTPSAAYFLFDRLDAARRRVELDGVLAELPGALRAHLAAALEPDAKKLLEERRRAAAHSTRGKTVVLQLSRGGPEGARMPLGPPIGYAAALSRLSEAILRPAVALYIWVDPDTSRRRNAERGDPRDPESIVQGVIPEDVMRQDYGCDDVDWLLSISETPDRIRVTSKEDTFAMPFVRFDNRGDRTAFLRGDPATWGADETANFHAALGAAFRRLTAAPSDRES